MALTHSPDPVNLLAGAGTAAEQSARPQLVADLENGGWVDADTIPSKGATEPGDTFPADPAITASDATNAAKLAGLGYVVKPPGTTWTVGQQFEVGTFAFHWAGTAWAAGAKPAAAPPPPPPAG